MKIEYNGRNKAAKQALENLIASGLIRRKDAQKAAAIEQRKAEFREALREAKAMAADIAVNGSAGYQTMDDFLKTL